MIHVYVNGVHQIPGIDFVAGESQLSFVNVPPAGSQVAVFQNGRTITELTCDGVTYLYQLDFNLTEYDNLIELLNTALKYSKVPAVADVLDRLKVVVELAKE
jgi:hypothetical protein